MDVIVEHAVLAAVFVEKAEGVGIGKVLKLDEAVYSKPVGRERKGHVIASSSWSLADVSLPWGGGGAGQGLRARLTLAVCAMWRAPGLLALPAPLGRRMGKAEGMYGTSWRPAKPVSLSLMWAGGLPWWLSGKESACQCRRHGFDPWSGKTPRAAEQLSLCAPTTESVLSDKRSHCKKQPRLHAKSSSRSLQLEKRPHSNKDPAQP